MTLPALGIDISKLKFNVCLINPNAKLRHYQTVPERASSRCLCWPGAARATIGDERQRAHEALKDRQCPAQTCTVLPGHHGYQVQPVLSSVGRRVAPARQVQDECHLCGDAETRSSGLWSVEDRKAIRSCMGKICLTRNTVSNPRRAQPFNAGRINQR
jgi:hypothetical protein